MNEDQYQTVTLDLDDGRRVTYSGRAQVDPEEAVKVVGVAISRPRPLPEGCRFEDVG